MTIADEKPLSIVHAIARLNVGGAALHVIELAARQRASGHEVVVVAGTLAEGEESMEYVAARSRRADRPAAGAAARAVTLRRCHGRARAPANRGATSRRRPPHPHGQGRCDRAHRRDAVARGGWPRTTVHTFHGHVLSGYFGSRRERAFIQVERLLARKTGAIVAVSDEVRDDLVRLGVAPPDKIVVIPYGFDLSGLSRPDEPERARRRSEIELPPEAFVVGWAGRLTPIKRPHDLVRTLAELGSQGTEGYLVVVGDGPERASVEALAAGARRPRALPLPGLPPRHEPLVRSLRCLSPHLGERGSPRRRDRGAGERVPRRGHERRWHGNGRPRGGVRLPGARGRDARAGRPAPRSRSRSPGSPARWGRQERSTSDGGSPRRPWPTPSTRSTGGSSTSHESPAHPQDHRDQRLGTSSSDAVARAARAGRRRPVPRPRRPRYGRTPLLPGARRGRSAVRARPVHDGPEPSHGRRGDQGRSPKQSRPAPHPSRARGHLRLDRLDRDPGAVRLLPPQRRQVPARPIPPRRPAVRPPGAQDHRDLGCRPPLPGAAPASHARSS